MIATDDVRAAARGDAMTPEEALRNILSLVDGSDEMEDVHALCRYFCRASRR
jgi:hypothetical protein